MHPPPPPTLRPTSQLGADNNTYPMFLLMHPSDHVRHTSNKKPLAVGAVTNWVEFPLTGCTPGQGNWQCPQSPAANPGWTSASDPNDWALVDQVNGTSYVRQLGSAAVKFATYSCDPNNPYLCADVITTRQSW